ncbi:unnamed protein product [Phaedon cochleariae]|uniref:Uncharacterized protein n=1 Tax=Phaedon cochleariae TaxID=80249 RepID=A0A9N9SAU9_PHACE|nr:unnamed protein product [Phaedon cochleariae]
MKDNRLPNLLLLVVLDAEPAATSFRWSFNSTPGIARDLTEFTEEVQSTSVLTYMPRVAADYGTIQAINISTQIRGLSMFFLSEAAGDNYFKIAKVMLHNSLGQKPA